MAQADPSDPAYEGGDLDSPVGRTTGHASSRSLDPADSGQLSSQRSLAGMLSLPTFKAQRRQTSGDMGSEVPLCCVLLPLRTVLRSVSRITWLISLVLHTGRRVDAG